MTTTTAPHPWERDAAAIWDAALAALPDADAWVAEAKQQVLDAHLVHDGEPVVAVARPRLLAARTLERDQQVVDAVSACLVSAARLAVADPAQRARCLGAWMDDPAFGDLFDVDPGYPQPIVIGRFDGVRSPDGLTVMEFNGGLPGGVTPMDLSASVMGRWSPFAEVEQAYDVAGADIGGALVAALRSTWSGFGGSGEPMVVLAVPDEMRPFLAISLAYLEGLAARHGLEVVLADPGALVHADGALRLQGRRVDLVVRVFFTSMLAALGSRLDGLTSAVRAGDVCLVTSFRSGLYGHKSLFALVTDPSVELDVDAAVRAEAVAHLPWTRLAAPGRTTGPDGSMIDVVEYALQARDHLVLKPSDGFGGAGVVLGWTQGPEEWRAAVAAAVAAGGAILQERLDLGSEEYPALEPGFPVRRFVTDHNPIVCDGTIAGYYARLSASGGLTNLTGGHGTVCPTFTLVDRR